MVKILQHAILYREERFHAAFPSLLRFSDDRLLLAFRRARDGLWLVPEAKRGEIDPFGRMDHIDARSHLALMDLEPDGQPIPESLTWLPMDPEAADQDPSLLWLPNDQVFLSSFSWYPLPADAAPYVPGRRPPGDEYSGCRFLFWGSHCSLRGREAESWIYHHNFIQPDGGFGHRLSPNDHGASSVTPENESLLAPDRSLSPTLSQDGRGSNRALRDFHSNGEKQLVGANRGRQLYLNGEILLPLYGGAGEGAALFASPDLGRSWRLRGRIARDPNGKVAFQEPALCDDGQGGLIAFMRTAGAGGRLASCRSSDAGATWSEPQLHALVGHPFHPLALADGRLLLTYGYRNNPYGIRARLMERPTDNPDDYPEIIIRDDGLCPDLGYPWAVELLDGRVLLAYYLTDALGIRHIEGSWLHL